MSIEVVQEKKVFTYEYRNQPYFRLIWFSLPRLTTSVIVRDFLIWPYYRLEMSIKNVGDKEARLYVGIRNNEHSPDILYLYVKEWYRVFPGDKINLISKEFVKPGDTYPISLPIAFAYQLPSEYIINLDIGYCIDTECTEAKITDSKTLTTFELPPWLIGITGGIGIGVTGFLIEKGFKR